MKSLAKSIIYEIYPTSFFDSNNDGVGDLKGIIEKLPYIKDLGADIIWLNPIFQSPFRDGGYDITDYYKIDKKFGTNEDLEELVKKAHELGIKILLDLVIGHTSDQHPWFKQSKKVKENKYTNYYIWTDNVFTGGSNTIKGTTKRNANYMVNFFAFQPALNYGFVGEKDKNGYIAGSKWKMHYTNEKLKPLRDEIEKIISFWADKGVDGYRVDLAGNMIKDHRNIDALKYFWNLIIGEAKKNYPNLIFLSEWGVIEDSTECMFDIDYFTHESIGYNEAFRCEKGTNIIPLFETGKSYFGPRGNGNITSLIDYTLKLQNDLKEDKYYSIPSGYHDMVRIATKKNDDLLKCIFAFLFTYKNLPLLYYGDEIGIKHNFKVNKDGGYIRTGARTPMQWNNDVNRGFSKASRLYLPVNKDQKASVEEQEDNSESLYCFVKELIKFRKENDVFDFDAKVDVLEKDYPLVYVREKNSKKVIVIINSTKNEIGISYSYKNVLFGENNIVGGNKLKPFSFVICSLG